ncbi:FMN reductase [Xanthobacter tagetidis]|jgi:FMN reductase|uniref:FMN reductase n=1 Tax=Xanthobacter tagetidis TaxID=60216 RepID=A0A3L7ALN1_9HYPH|nr:FMN reductase [Xanthobacter tagetidis]MBB6307623.1 FMN reductase [Xanthobacter tagetidis]RLP81187.1 FMN reductase [Xanthobacter tagetidis]
MIPRIVGFSGSTRRPSRTRALIETIGAEVSARRAVSLEIYDLVDAGPAIGTSNREALPRAAQAIVSAIEEADALIVGSPVYKGSYAGLFKHLIDFVDPTALAGTPVILAATGGGHRHALVVEHQLRPLFGFFAALTLPTAIYAGDQDFREGVIADHAVSARIAQAAGELDRALAFAVRHPIPNVA